MYGESPLSAHARNKKHLKSGGETIEDSRFTWENIMKIEQRTNRSFEPPEGSQEYLSLARLSNPEKRLSTVEQSFFTSPLPRRRFVKTLGIMTGSIVAFDTLLFSKEAEAIPWAVLAAKAAKALAAAVLAAVAAEVARRGVEYVFNKIDEAQIIDSCPCRNFHDQFCNPVKFDLVEPPMETIFKYFFGINGHPQTAPEAPIAPIYELNVYEIYVIIDQRNPANCASDGSFFVPYPHEERRRPGAMDEKVFYNTPVIYDRYRVNPRLFQIDYVRCFSNGRDLLTGYGVRTRQAPYRRGFFLV